MNSISIGDHGIIGNMRSAALINIRGDVDFFCFPEFDSPSVFASILDEEKGGTFAVRPGSDAFQLKQLYLPETNVLLTRFISDNGIAEVSDSDKRALNLGDDGFRVGFRPSVSGVILKT